MPRKRTEEQLDGETIKQVTKKHRNRPDLANFGQEYAEPGDAARYVAFARAQFNQPKVDMSRPELVQERIDEYFKMCETYDIKPGIAGLATALGVSRKTLWAWKAGTANKTAPEESLDIIRKTYDTIETLWEMYMMDNKIAPGSGIFLSKNHFGYRDVQEVMVAPKDPFDGKDPEEVARKYIQGAVADAPEEIDGDGKVD